jgi:hypothetical protein
MVARRKSSLMQLHDPCFILILDEIATECVVEDVVTFW